jgi:hypothetical protein
MGSIWLALSGPMIPNRPSTIWRLRSCSHGIKGESWYPSCSLSSPPLPGRRSSPSPYSSTSTRRFHPGMSSTQIHGHQSTGAMATVGSPSHGGRFLSSSSGSRCGSRGRGGRGGRAAGPRGRSGGGVDGPDGRAVAVDLTWAMGSPHGGSSAAVTRSEQMPPAAMAPSPRPQPCPTQVRREGIQWLQACCLRRREVGGRGRKITAALGLVR